MIKQRFLFSILSVLILSGYRVPLNLPVSLSGSYGELRSTHFHSGVDFRVGGVVGAPVYAAREGYISRVTVSPTGYGNAVYINHPDGKTTLYGHLHDFADEIQEWVRSEQYKRKSFSVFLSPPETLFIVNKGDFIGRAGNSGSSGGPHLHFEMRETESQQPVNPLKYADLSVVDNIAPVIQRVNFYSISKYQTLPEKSLLQSFTGVTNNTVSVTDTFYIAVAGIDRQNNTNARLAVYYYNYYLNGELIFSFSPDSIQSNKGRYINSLVEYSVKENTGQSMVKSWVEPGSGLTQSIYSVNDGLFIIKDDNIHEVKVELIDEHYNTTIRKFRVRRRESTGVKTDYSLVDSTMIMPWYLPNRFISEGVRLFIPTGSLYSTILFDFGYTYSDGNKIVQLHDRSTPLHYPVRLAIEYTMPDEFKEKALIVQVDKNGRYSSAGGRYYRGWIETSISSFGNFTLSLDTIAPVIVPGFTDGQDLRGRDNIRFTISDDLSGISNYEVYIDGKWILTSYDPKNRRLITELKDDVIRRGGKHILEISVTDNRANTNKLKSTFIW